MRPPLPTQPSMLSEPDCVTDPDSWCGTVFHWTGNEWLAMYSDLLIAKPLHILLILIGAYLLRWAVHRMITRFMQGNGDQPPKLLQPLRERKAGTLSADLLSERRLQRTRTIGSILKSLSSFLIYGLALVYVLQVLVEVGRCWPPRVWSVAVAFRRRTSWDFLSGMFMLVEDQYGVGDVVTWVPPAPWSPWGCG